VYKIKICNHLEDTMPCKEKQKYNHPHQVTKVQHTSMGFMKIFAILTFGFAFICLFWYALVRNVNPPQMLSLSDDHDILFQHANEAQLSDKWSNELELDIEDEGKFHIISNVILVTHKHYSSNLLYDNTRIPTNKQLEMRQHEIETALQNNLNNKLVAAIHILYFHPAVHSYLLRLKLTNSKKMILHLTRRDPTVGVNLDYIQKYLQHKAVMLMHIDNFMGGGWDLVDIQTLRTKRIMYALTRHSVTEEYPCNAASSASCNPGSMYLGSHDTFMFYVDKAFPQDMLKQLDIVPSSSGMENLLIWYFDKELKYKVLNPCRKLIVYHNHCVPIREKNRQRYNRRGKNGMVPFSSDLE